MNEPSIKNSPDATIILYDTRLKDRPTVPEATLIIPVYNVVDYVEECLASVFANAATVDLEVIIIDDGSTDTSGQHVTEVLARLQPPQTLFVKQANQGLSAVRNRGVSLAKGDFIGFLDSDDMLTAGGMRTLLDFARQNDCDLVFGKSQVFDSRSHAVQPFYDDWAWAKLLLGAPTRIISRHEEPVLFFLEPNANYRLVRRELFSLHGFSYPVGRLFEDPPVHYKMLASAARIGLVDIPYYWYRVNRPGKITAERSRRRFDILAVANETFAELSQAAITAEAGGVIVYGLSRIVWWCGTMTLPEHREEFFRKASAIFTQQAPPAWVTAFGKLGLPEAQELIVDALLRGETDWLVHFSHARRQPLQSLLFLIRMGRQDLIIRRLRVLANDGLKRFRTQFLR